MVLGLIPVYDGSSGAQPGAFRGLLQFLVLLPGGDGFKVKKTYAATCAHS
jgi:hypothetical protein